MLGIRRAMASRGKGAWFAAGAWSAFAGRFGGTRAAALEGRMARGWGVEFLDAHLGENRMR